VSLPGSDGFLLFSPLWSGCVSRGGGESRCFCLGKGVSLRDNLLKLPLAEGKGFFEEGPIRELASKRSRGGGVQIRAAGG